MSELKPCPVCRSKMKIFTRDDDKSGKRTLFYGASVCTKCDTVLPAWMAGVGFVVAKDNSRVGEGEKG